MLSQFIKTTIFPLAIASFTFKKKKKKKKLETKREKEKSLKTSFNCWIINNSDLSSTKSLPIITFAFSLSTIPHPNNNHNAEQFFVNNIKCLEEEEFKLSTTNLDKGGYFTSSTPSTLPFSPRFPFNSLSITCKTEFKRARFPPKLRQMA